MLSVSKNKITKKHEKATTQKYPQNSVCEKFHTKSNENSYDGALSISHKPTNY